jgi:hypothetical protein
MKPHFKINGQMIGDLKDTIEIKFGKPKGIAVQQYWPCGAVRKRTHTFEFTVQDLNKALWEVLIGGS